MMATETGQTAVLEVEGLTKEFGALTALNGVDLRVEEGEIVALIGPNGAGKSTFFNCLMSVFPVTSGNIWFRGEEITNLATDKIVKRGISRSFQVARVFPKLTVRENMAVFQEHATENMLATTVTSPEGQYSDRIAELLEMVDLIELADQPANDLSGGQKRLLTIASALLRDPDLILLDEPTAGVNPSLVDRIMDIVMDLNDRGHTFLFIEHDMDVMRRIAERTYVFANGQNLVDGRPDDVLTDDRVLEAYFGE
jgi:branched-chain amino acid transport system ATP-binding protein